MSAPIQRTRTTAGTADREPEGPSILWLVTKWVLLRLWARPTIAVVIFAVIVTLGLLVSGRWWQLVTLIAAVIGAYFADRIWNSGKLLRSYRGWAAIRAATYRVKFQWNDLMDDLRLVMKYPSGYVARPVVRRVDHVNGSLVVTFDSLGTQHLGDFEGNAERFRTFFGGLRVSFRELYAGRYELRITQD